MTAVRGGLRPERMKKKCRDRGTPLAAAAVPVSGGEEGRMTAVRGWPETGEVRKECLDHGTLLAAVEVPVSGGTVKVSADTIDRREMVRITD